MKRIALVLALVSVGCGGVIEAHELAADTADAAPCADYVPDAWTLYPCGDDPRGPGPKTHRPEMTALDDGGWSGRCACITASSP